MEIVVSTSSGSGGKVRLTDRDQQCHVIQRWRDTVPLPAVARVMETVLINLPVRFSLGNYAVMVVVI